MERSDKREMKQPESAKKPYSRPRLEVYGNLREITQATGRAGGADNPNPNHAHTLP